MIKRILATAVLLASAAPMPAAATVVFLANGTLSGGGPNNDLDLSGLTGNLENGQPAAILGGLGSGLAWAGGNTFIGTPDRGPNAVPFASSVDDTTSYISRLETMTMALTPSTSGPLPFTLTPTLTGTTLLYSPTALTYGDGSLLDNNGKSIGSGAPSMNDSSHFYYTGRSDGFVPGTSSGAIGAARFDPESVRVSADGKSVFISDEYGPYVRQFDRATGQLLATVKLPSDLYVANQSSVGNTEIDNTNNPTGRVANKGMEGLAITPDGKTLVGIMQANLEQDPSKTLRIVTVDIASGATHEYAYKVTTGSGVSDIVAISATQFLVDERDGNGLGDGSKAKVKQLFAITVDPTKDTDITGMSLNSTDLSKLTYVSKAASPFLDLVTALGNAPGSAKVTPANVPSKIEGVAFGQDVTLNGTSYHTVYIGNDNDFSTGSGPNQFYVFGFQDSDLPGFVQQQIAAVPEPASWLTFIAGFGALGGFLRRRRRVAFPA